MKKLLFVIHGLDCGGAEKSLISLLEAFPEDLFEIDLLVGNHTGVFMKDIPKNVNLLNDLYEFENYASALNSRRRTVAGLRDGLLQLNWQLKKRFYNENRKLSLGEFKWISWGKHLPKIDKRYDLAISYMNGFPNYFVIEKVEAKAKMLWIHNEFEKLGYNVDFERKYFDAADCVVTISDSCAESILGYYPDLRNKVFVLENISSGSVINSLANEKIDDDFFTYSGKKIVSVGRLMPQKNIHLAIEAAAKMRSMGLDFIWYNLGEGELREQLEKEIADKGLRDVFFLAGIKTNPYPYIKASDVFVQTSLYEGKSIALDEAKILQKPIVITNYATSVNSINNGVEGLITDMDAQSVADGIKEVLENKELRDGFIHNLLPYEKGNVDEIEKYIELIKHCLDK